MCTIDDWISFFQWKIQHLRWISNELLISYLKGTIRLNSCSWLPTLWWHVYLGVEVAALLHKRADHKPEAVGQAELVDCPRQRNVVAVRIQCAHETTLMTSWPPPSGAKFQGQLHRLSLYRYYLSILSKGREFLQVHYAWNRKDLCVPTENFLILQLL